MDTRVVDHREENQYELWADGERIGLIAYRLRDDVMTMIHTEVQPSYGGQGLAGVLVKEALDDVRERGLSLVPLCPYVAAYLEKHPEYADLVAQ